MNKNVYIVAAIMTTMVAACVTINVYFPEAAAREAATEFISGVLNDDAGEVIDPGSADTGHDNGSAQTGPGLDVIDAAGSASVVGFAPMQSLLNLLVAPAQAQQSLNIDINTPSIQAIQLRMRDRQKNVLRSYYEAGAIGLDNKGLVQIRDLTAVGLSERTRLKQAVHEDNQDRNAVYREIAVANGHPEWEDEIRSTFAERWIELAPAGWYYLDNKGNWQQK